VALPLLADTVTMTTIIATITTVLMEIIMAIITMTIMTIIIITSKKQMEIISSLLQTQTRKLSYSMGSELVRTQFLN
jgi:hypothetical protein